MINKFTSPSERTDLDNTGVGVLALISMYHVVLFLILQILVFVVLLPVVFLLPELGALNEKTAGIVSLAILVVVDITLITVLARRGRRSFSEQMEMARTRAGEYNSAELPHAPRAFTEFHLEMAFGATALASLVGCLLLGLQSLSVLISLTVVETFALLFLLMFMAIRFLATREIRLTALSCLILTGLSLWSLIRGLRI